MIIHVKVSPNSKTNEIIRAENGEVKIKIKAPPVDGKANVYLVKFLAKELGISKSRITILRGHTSSFKKLEIQVDEETLKRVGIK